MVLPLLGAFMLCAGAQAVAAQSSEEVLGHVRERYATIRDAEISFTQKTVFAGSRVEQTSSGSLLLKKENMYRVEMEGQTVVTDGKTVWSYSRPTHQVLIDLFNADARARTPERILMGETDDYTATLLGRETSGGRELVGVKLNPRGDQSAGGTIRLWVDPKTWLIRKAVLEDGNGKETVYTVNEIRVNIGVADSRFDYEIPEGAEVVDLR
jgi:outer membrane lipoprotein carrier protein